MLRYALACSLFLAAPALAQGQAAGRAAHCVHVAMASLLTVGAAPQQIAPIALARCFDEIEAVLADAKTEAVRIALRRELHDYALEVASVAADAVSVALEPVADTRRGAD